MFGLNGLQEQAAFNSMEELSSPPKKKRNSRKTVPNK